MGAPERLLARGLLERDLSDEYCLLRAILPKAFGTTGDVLESACPSGRCARFQMPVGLVGGRGGASRLISLRQFVDVADVPPAYCAGGGPVVHQLAA